ncbi:hypothetical protein [Methanothermococcus okinawensis]|nr:hypothetical protein [Methanothermococcus okinawensis]
MKYYNSIIVLLIIILMFISLPKGFPKIYSYEDIIFYPNETQSINISKLYIDYSNPNAFSIYLYYNNATNYIPYPKNITVDVPPKKINISINISASRNNNIWTIYYKIYNNYNFNISINVSFPEGYDIKNVSIKIPPSSYKLIKLKRYLNSDKLHFNDSNISFKVPSRIKVRYSKSIPFSITKSSRPLNNGTTKWIATYNINNTQSITLNTNITYWAVVNNSKINLGNESSILKPNQSIIRTFNVDIPNGGVPVFYINFKAWHDTYENITIKPAFNINNKYIIGIAKVKGLDFYIPYNTYPPSPPQTTYIPSPPKHHITTTPSNNPHNTINPPNNKNTPSHQHTKTKENNNKDKETSENTEHEEVKPKELKLFAVVIKHPNSPKKIKSAVVLNGVISPIILALLPLLYLNRRKTLIISGELPDELAELIYLEFKNIYVPEGCNYKNLYNPIIYKFSDEERMDIRDLHELKDIPLNDAKAIISALNTTRTVVYLSSKKSYEIAINIGLEVHYNDGKHGNW